MEGAQEKIGKIILINLFLRLQKGKLRNELVAVLRNGVKRVEQHVSIGLWRK